MKNFQLIVFITLITFSCGKQDQKENVGHDESQASDELIIEKIESPKQEERSELEKQLILQGLIDIQEVDSTIIVDLKYSSLDNFFGEDVYGSFSKAYLQPSVAKDLKRVQDLLNEEFSNLSLIVFDGVRPLSIQHILWEALDSIPPVTRKAYVADPAEGSIHNYGCAVDLSIYDLEADTLLDMGTKYDYFGYLAYPRKEQEMLNAGKLNIEQVENRNLLRSMMAKAGFMPITSEWWHFNRVSRARAKIEYEIIK